MEEGLTDQQLQQFICDGYLVIKSSLPEEFHQKLFSDALKLYENEGNVGNNIYPKVPELLKVYNDKPVASAIESLIGKNWIMQPHRHPHLNRPGSNFQQWHKDTYFGFTKPVRTHQIKNIMGMYYPQKTTVEMAATQIKPQTQYSTIDPKKYRGELPNQHKKGNKKVDISLTCEQGTILLIHYDLIHRGTGNTSNKDRFMFKFQFTRSEYPTKPTWNCTDLTWKMPKQMNKSLEPIGKHIWNWMCGTDVKLNKIDLTDELYSKLNSKEEDIRQYANYTIAQSEEFEILFKRLSNEEIQFALNAAYALVSTGKHAVPGLIECLSSSSVIVQYLSAFVLSEIGPPAKEAIPALLKLLHKKNQNLDQKFSNFARIYIVEAFGSIGEITKEVIEALCERTVEKYEPDAQVRFTSALSLVKLKCETSVEALGDCLKDKNRYVREFAMIALERIESKKSLEIFRAYRKKYKGLDPLTNNKDTY